jgi:hypothetical protein
LQVACEFLASKSKLTKKTANFATWAFPSLKSGAALSFAFQFFMVEMFTVNFFFCVDFVTVFPGIEIK